MKKINIGTRGSQLALAQAESVKQFVKRFFPYIEVKIVTFQTQGDRIQNKNFSEIDGNGKGLFTKEIDQALIDGRIDCAVHSMKDVLALSNELLGIVCVPAREDPRDAFISFTHSNILALPLESVVGTSSLRRRSFVQRLRPDIHIVPFRGNVGTRLNKLSACVADATFLAMAGLKRLQIDVAAVGASRLGGDDKKAHSATAAMRVAAVHLDAMVPAPAQGALGVYVRKCDMQTMHHIFQKLHNPYTYICLCAEKAFSDVLGGSCHTAIGAIAYCSRAFVNDVPQGDFLFSAKQKFISQNSNDMIIFLGGSFHPRTGQYFQCIHQWSIPTLATELDHVQFQTFINREVVRFGKQIQNQLNEIDNGAK